MKQSRIGLGVVTMLNIFVVLCMCILVLYSSSRVYQKHEQINRAYAYKKAYYVAEMKAHEKMDAGESDFMVHVLEDTYIHVTVKNGQINTFKTVIKGE